MELLFGSPSRGRLLSSVEVKYHNPGLIRKKVELFAKDLKANHPEIIRVIWFGSWIMGGYSPGSDVDLCIIVDHAAKAHRDRPVRYLPHGFPVGLDICVYTEKEFKKLSCSHGEWHAAILEGVEV